MFSESASRCARLLLASITTFLLACAASVVRGEPVDRPNIVLILADDLGYEGLSVHGSQTYQTPRLDALARGGMRFRHCYSQPLCTPSRVKIMTGKFNYRNYTSFGELQKGELTFANVLKKAGYATAVAGKWQLGGDGQTVRDFGFDTHCLWHITGRQSRYWEPRILRDGKEITESVSDRYGPDVFCEFIEEFVARHRERPFLVYYPMVLPHWPFVPTPDSPPEGSRERSGRYDGRRGGLEYFPDMVAYVDKIVGRIVDRLAELGLRERTLVMFTCDNGSAVNVTSEFRGETLRGGKGFMTDAGDHVPLAASWPGAIPEGKVSDALIDFSDFLPTLAEAAGVSIPDGLTIDGESFLPVLRGHSEGVRTWRLCHYNSRPPSRPADGARRQEVMERLRKLQKEKKIGRYVRDQRYKLFSDGRFYDTVEDPREERPLAPGDLSGEARKAHERFGAVLEDLPAFQWFRGEAAP